MQVDATCAEGGLIRNPARQGMILEERKPDADHLGLRNPNLLSLEAVDANRHKAKSLGVNAQPPAPILRPPPILLRPNRHVRIYLRMHDVVVTA